MTEDNKNIATELLLASIQPLFNAYYAIFGPSAKRLSQVAFARFLVANEFAINEDAVFSNGVVVELGDKVLQFVEDLVREKTIEENTKAVFDTLRN